MTKYQTNWIYPIMIKNNDEELTIKIQSFGDLTRIELSAISKEPRQFYPDTTTKILEDE